MQPQPAPTKHWAVRRGWAIGVFSDYLPVRTATYGYAVSASTSCMARMPREVGARLHPSQPRHARMGCCMHACHTGTGVCPCPPYARTHARTHTQGGQHKSCATLEEAAAYLWEDGVVLLPPGSSTVLPPGVNLPPGGCAPHSLQLWGFYISNLSLLPEKPMIPPLDHWSQPTNHNPIP
jgi:hypothetical protein